MRVSGSQAGEDPAAGGEGNRACPGAEDAGTNEDLGDETQEIDGGPGAGSGEIEDILDGYEEVEYDGASSVELRAGQTMSLPTIVMDDHFSAAITSAGDLYCWGYNGYGQVGNGTTDDQSTPVKVLDQVSTVSVYGYVTMAAIKSNGDLYCWGYNGHGQVGNGTTTDQSTPTKIMDLMNGGLGPLPGDEPTDDSVESFTLDQIATGIFPGDDLTISGTVYLKEGQTAGEEQWERIINNLTWTSSDPSVTGEVRCLIGLGDIKETNDRSFYVRLTPKSTGAAVITGMLPNGMSQSCEVIVREEKKDPVDETKSYIVRRVSRYTSDELHAQFDDIFHGNCSMDANFPKFYELFTNSGFTNVKEGTSYLSSTSVERQAYLKLTTDDHYMASQFTDELNKDQKGAALKAVLAIDGLVFNSEWKTWVDPLTYIDGEIPGVAKYKEMLYDYMEAQSKRIELANNIKMASELLDKVTGYVKDTALHELENCDPSEFWTIVGKYDVNFDDDFKFDANSGFGKFAKAEGYAFKTISVANMLLEDVIGLIQLDSKLAAYEENKKFLNEVIRSADDIPSELRYAAYLVCDEMEAGVWNNVQDLCMDIIKFSTITSGLLKTILEKYGYDVASGIVGGLLN